METRVLFVPSVGNFRQGMIVSIPLQLAALAGKPAAADFEKALAKHYQASIFVSVVEAEANGKLDAEGLNDTNHLDIRVVANAKQGHAVLIARLDNLGKGASGAAVQNLSLMLGLNLS
jgi:N-acetyl-gamma-glutamyl-phosphate reductase